MKLKRLLSYVRKAVEDYSMIDEGDRIAVGISGGKDSLSLLVALKELSKFYPKKFEVEAVSVSLGFEDMDFSPVERLCKEIDVPFTLVETQIKTIIFDERKEKNPCSLCAKLRKGALNNKVESLGCNKVALGHNRDDIIETFLMSLFYEGRIHTFSPITYLERKNIMCIRPLMYAPEGEVMGFVNKYNIETVKNKCPADGETKREDMKEFIRQQRKKYDHLDEKLFGAIKRSKINGWDKESDK